MSRRGKVLVVVGGKGSDSTGREVQATAWTIVDFIGRRRVAIGGGLTSEVVVALSLFMLLTLVETSENALGVVITLLHGPDNGGMQTLDNLVHKEVKLLIVNAVLSHVRDGCAGVTAFSSEVPVMKASFSSDVVDVSDNDLEGITDNLVVGHNSVHGLAELAILKKHGIHDLADLALLSNDLIDRVTGAGEDTLEAGLNVDETFDLAFQNVDGVLHLLLVTGVNSIDHVLGRLDWVRLVFVLVGLVTLRSSAGEARLLDVKVRRSHVHHVATSLKGAVAIDAKGGAVVMAIDVRVAAKLDTQAASLVVKVAKRATRGRATRAVARHTAERTRLSTGVFVDIVLKTAVAVGLVGRSVGVEGIIGGRGLLLLATGIGEVISQDGGFATVTVENVVFGAVDVVIVTHSANVLDRLDTSTSKSTIGLLTSVDR